MSELAVIGIDPGKVTGTFEWNSVRGNLYEANWIGRELPAEDIPLYLSRRLRAMAKRPDMQVYIAVEKYIITARTAKLTQQTDALEVTGMVKAVAALSQLAVSDRVSVRQYAKTNLKFASDDMLKRAYWYSVGERHANDAARQAFALLKDVRYPAWAALLDGATMEPTTDDERNEDA